MILSISTKNVKIIKKSAGLVGKYPMDPAFFSLGEVKDKETFLNFIKDLIYPNTSKNESVIVLIENDLVYDFELASGAEDNNEKVNSELKKIPYKTTSLVWVASKDKDNSKIYATQKDLTDLLVKAIYATNHTCKYVFPDVVLNKLSNKTNAVTTIGEEISEALLIKNLKLIKHLNFKKLDEVSASRVPLRQTALLVVATVCFLLLLGSVFLGMARDASYKKQLEDARVRWEQEYQLKTSSQNLAPQLIETTQSTQSTESVVTLDAVPITELSFMVLNGSKIPGQALKVAKALEPLNISSEIEVDNSDEPYVLTTVYYDEKVSAEARIAIEDILKEFGYKSLSVKDSVSGEVDVLIVTGSSE